MFPIFIQFKTSLDLMCGQVDHEFARRRSSEALERMVDATLHTTSAINQLQQHTQALGADLHGRMERSSSAVVELLSAHSIAESDRFAALSEATSKLERGQDGLLTHLTSHTTHLRDLLTDAQLMQRMINATSSDIAATQEEILELQTNTASTLGDTREELMRLKTSQQRHFEEALSSLSTLHSLSVALSAAQAASSAAVQQLSQDQEAAFSRAADALAVLHSDQAAAFASGARQIADMRAAQAELASTQAESLHVARDSSAALAALAAAQRAAFDRASGSLDRIHQQASAVEAKLGGMLADLQSMAQRLLTLNLDMLQEVFRVHSALFYVALAPVAYIASATERTKSSRFWLFLMLLATLVVELNLVSATQRFRLALTTPEFDAIRTRLRLALSTLSLLVVALSAVMHRDYDAMSHALHERNRRVIDNNHRMLHELLRRTEHLVSDMHTHDERAMTGAREGIPFRQMSPRENPADEGRRAPAASRHSSSWQQLPVDGPTACCDDHRPTRGLMAKLIDATTSPFSRASDRRSAARSFVRESLPNPYSVSQDSMELESDNSESETTVAHEDAFSGPHSPAAMSHRSTRSRSRSRSRGTDVSAPSTSRLRSHAVVNSDAIDEEDAEDACDHSESHHSDDQPGLTYSTEDEFEGQPKRRQRRSRA